MGNPGPVPGGRVRRVAPLAGLTLHAAGGRMVAALREKVGDDGAVQRFHAQTAERYADLLGRSKGVLMKAGQMFSLIDAAAVGRAELVPYQRALSGLCAGAPPMAPALVAEVVAADLGRPLGQVFADFEDEPTAAASIGQVHRAVLADGRQVAVKIQYPGVAAAIRADLANAELLVTLSRFAGLDVPDLRPIMQEISARIAEEVDYRHEAANITAFHDLYRGHPFIRVPEVIGEASGNRVLTMTFLDGLDWAGARAADQQLKNTWAEVISRMITGSHRHGNLFHADPHPCNYRFGLDGSVGFVDFGCVKKLPEQVRRGMISIPRAVIDARRHDLRAAMVDGGFFAEDSSLSSEEVYHWFSAMMHTILQPQPVTFTTHTAGRVLGTLTEANAPSHPLRRMAVPPDFVFFIRLCLAMNAVLTALNATLDIRALLDDLDGMAAPTTELGKAHHAWVRRRGLPCGMDHHESVYSHHL